MLYSSNASKNGSETCFKNNTKNLSNKRELKSSLLLTFEFLLQNGLAKLGYICSGFSLAIDGSQDDQIKIPGVGKIVVQ